MNGEKTMKKYYLKGVAGTLSAVLAIALLNPLAVRADAQNGWNQENGEWYWYESGVKQGTTGRGKEIYDPASDAWYWLDAVDGGRMAVSKDVYQESYAGQFADREDGTGKWVRYDENGHMVKGWQSTDKGTYYFDMITGAMAKGAADLDVDGQTVPCYFDPTTGVGANLTWIVLDGNKYWYEDGVRQGMKGRGKEIYDPASDAWYWLDSVDNGKMAVSKDVYQESYAGAFAENEDGTGKWVRYDENGHMVKGWDDNDKGTYYFDMETGAMAKGLVNIDGHRYYFNPETGICERGDMSWYLTCETEYSNSGSVRNKTVYKYDEDRNLCNKAVYNGSGTLLEEDTYKYEDGLLDKHTFSKSTGYGWAVEYQYSGDTVTKEIYFDENNDVDYVIAYEYDSKGRVAKKTKMQPDSTVLSYDSYSYSKDGNTVEVKYYIPKVGSKTKFECNSKEIFTYENGREIKEASYTVSGSKSTLNWYYATTYREIGQQYYKTSYGFYQGQTTPLWEEKYTYDDDGQLTKYRYYTSAGRMLYYTVFDNSSKPKDTDLKSDYTMDSVTYDTNNKKMYKTRYEYSLLIE